MAIQNAQERDHKVVGSEFSQAAGGILFLIKWDIWKKYRFGPKIRHFGPKSFDFENGDSFGGLRSVPVLGLCVNFTVLSLYIGSLQSQQGAHMTA